MHNVKVKLISHKPDPSDRGIFPENITNVTLEADDSDPDMIETAFPEQYNYLDPRCFSSQVV
jgi:hypothetical protein